MAAQDRKPGDRAEWWVPALFALFSALWIYGSDALVASISISIEQQRAISTYKGFGYVLVATLLLHFGMRAALRRERAEAKRVLEARQFNDQIIQGALEGIAVYDRDLRYQVWNPFMEHLTGIPASAVLGRRAPEVFSFLMEVGVLDRMKRNLAGEVFTAAIDFHYTRPSDGMNIWASNQSGPLRDSQGEIVGVLAFVRDITARKMAEETDRRQAEELDLFFQTNLDLLCIASLEGCFLRLNREWERALGYSLQELEGTSFLDLVHPEDLSKTMEAVAQLSNKGEVTGFTNRYRHKDGSYRCLEWRSVPTGSLIHAAARDITEHRLAEEAQQKSASQLRTLIDTMPDLVWLKSPEGVYLECNRRFERFFGAKEVDIVGKTDYDFVDRKLANFFRAGDQAAMNAETPTMNEEEITFADDGHHEILETIKTPIRGSGGDVIGVLGIGRDITERKQAEEEKSKLQAQLQQSQKMESLGILAGGVAHDMNNVLGAILGLASAHIGSLPPDSPLRQALDTICKATIRGGGMVKSLLSFARQSPAVENELDMNVILREQVDFLKRTTLAKVYLEQDLEPELRPIRGDGSALAHAFMNLCLNAVDAMPENGTLTLHTRNLDNDWIEVVVEDNGMGMPREVLDKAMDPFFTTKEMGKGTGLGLSMVFITVKAHQGQMAIESEPGKGTRVRLRFPVCEKEAQAAGPAVAEASLTPHGALKVLLVDDDDLIQSSVQMILEVLGHTAVTTAQNGEEALAILEAGLEPDLVILDMNMPGLGGIGTLPRLRVLFPGMPVLLATGRVDQAALTLASAHPGVSLLAKPFGLRELQQRLIDIGLG